MKHKLILIALLAGLIFCLPAQAISFDEKSTKHEIKTKSKHHKKSQLEQENQRLKKELEAMRSQMEVVQRPNFDFSRFDPQRTDECRIAHLDKRKLLQAEATKIQLEAKNFFILTNDEVNYVSNELDLTNAVISDGHRVLNNTQNQLDKIRTFKCNVAYINVVKLLENYHQAKASKQQLGDEFLGWDKALVAMKNNESSEAFALESKRFTDAFIIRRNEELAKLEKVLTDEIRNFSHQKKFNLIVTESTENFKKIAGRVNFPDVTEDFRRFTEYLSEEKTMKSD